MDALVRSNKLAVEYGFHPCTCSGIAQLQGVLDNFTTKGAFVCTDEITTGDTYRNGNGGYFFRRTFTVFILRRYAYGDETSRISSISICRELARQIQSRMLRDRQTDDRLNYLDLENVPLTEFGEYLASGCTGLYMMLTISEPTSLCYNTDDWND